MTIGERFHIFIEHTGQNPAEMARKLNTSRTTITRIIDGTNLPSSKILVPLIEQHPELNLYWLLKGIESMIREEKEPNKRKIEYYENEIEQLKKKIVLLKELVNTL